MRIARVFVDLPLAPGDAIALPPPACEHLLRVLRLGDGAPLVLCNGDGNDYRAELQGAGKRGASARILSAASNLAESPLRVVLVQALARGEKMDLVVQKATELGVVAIRPVITERTEVRLDAERAGRRLAHWRAVAEAACEQCGRARLPAIAEPVGLGHYLGDVDAHAVRLVLEPGGLPLAEIVQSAVDATSQAPIHVVVGPEGGFSERDLAQLRAAGFKAWRLGSRILRTETAGLAAVAALQALFGDFR